MRGRVHLLLRLRIPLFMGQEWKYANSIDNALPRRACLLGTVSIDGKKLFRRDDAIEGENSPAHTREIRQRFDLSSSF
ncbi:hypothetical protein KEJ39_08100 [Candidatus Bathyarchaeota archaeon]|nr:hypothetical protein [Candidatus Bathyarchaeota archaeon]